MTEQEKCELGFLFLNPTKFYLSRIGKKTICYVQNENISRLKVDPFASPSMAFGFGGDERVRF